MSMVLRRGGWGMTQHSTDSGPCGAATSVAFEPPLWLRGNSQAQFRNWIVYRPTVLLAWFSS